ncbi:hypothetical protein OSTOST_11207, partial [Ostertagia ostertagi]
MRQRQPPHQIRAPCVNISVHRDGYREEFESHSNINDNHNDTNSNSTLCDGNVEMRTTRSICYYENTTEVCDICEGVICPVGKKCVKERDGMLFNIHVICTRACTVARVPQISKWRPGTDAPAVKNMKESDARNSTISAWIPHRPSVQLANTTAKCMASAITAVIALQDSTITLLGNSVSK